MELDESLPNENIFIKIKCMDCEGVINKYINVGKAIHEQLSNLKLKKYIPFLKAHLAFFTA